MHWAGLCDVIYNAGTSKALCTRALWCLANQNFSSSQMTDHVATIVSMVAGVLLSQEQATPTVDIEALNLFVRSEFMWCGCGCSLFLLYNRLEHQCECEFRQLAQVWYKVLVARLLFSKNSKVSRQRLLLPIPSLSLHPPLPPLPPSPLSPSPSPSPLSPLPPSPLPPSPSFLPRYPPSLPLLCLLLNLH